MRELPGAAMASARMPASFRRSMTRSFGHLIMDLRPAAASMPSASATPTAIVRRAVARTGSVRAAAGSIKTDTYRPLPGGENQERPRRPRPAVCASATTTPPSRCPAVASDEATSLVDPTVEKYRTGDPNRPSRAPARASASTKSDGSGSDGGNMAVNSQLTTLNLELKAFEVET